MAFTNNFSDYGMLESWKCEKVFRLEKSNPDDMYYLNSNDGMLYMSDQEPYDSDNYCVSTRKYSFFIYELQQVN